MNGDGLSTFLARRLREDGGWILIFLAVALIPVKGWGNGPMAVMAALGAWHLVRHGAALWADVRVRLLASLFLCIWLPMLLSLPAAVQFERSAVTVIAFLRFPLAGLFVIEVLAKAEARRRLAAATAVLVGAWCLDGVLQWQLGRNVLGFPYNEANLTGIFHPRRLIGLVVAALAAIYFDGVRRLATRHAAAWLLIVPAVLVVALGGSRTSWMMLVVGGLVWGGYRYAVSSWRGRHVVAAALVVLALAAVPAIAKMPGMEWRVEQTMQVFKGDYEALNEASGMRLPIWEVSIEMIREHWLTGIGPRGFRYLYTKYADSDNPHVMPDSDEGPTHPHQIVLEVATETGVIGLIGFLLFWVMFAFALRRPGAASGWEAVPWACGLLAALFPLNAHMAIYGTFWAHLSWWLLIIMVAMMWRGRAEAERP